MSRRDRSEEHEGRREERAIALRRNRTSSTSQTAIPSVSYLFESRQGYAIALPPTSQHPFLTNHVHAVSRRDRHEEHEGRRELKTLFR
ncbi:hypothetical protein [Anabaena catenula]|uniref:Uncharacterized protein n=1 Tax=Anabaena catenula FACHB-362 TaxID=2692877 RepID=A0ABR8J825_9NOST|nr:hypothetical protein [Anabaena catenula]MBD2694521.1 hypothetical protein [Anabaena catenula FACHB-362]